MVRLYGRGDSYRTQPINVGYLYEVSYRLYPDVNDIKRKKLSGKSTEDKRNPICKVPNL